jgi:hypothetical protein
MLLINKVLVINKRLIRNDYSDAKTQEIINWRIPAGVTLGQVIIDSNQVGTFAT